ncbi:MAG TPA: hypothetical protein H9714_03365 [Candidatus Flavonifractor intestinipullorum]|uniref:Uncharacterized protein n=1 Tax=Candidatus Flavonifractor intestinipullorum TaxID=2838587 RepID=A0A9D2MAF7_9FIRM|nr:hypothetical protein [Candidatus Flavonifractor intestinipullorum]
MADPTLRVALKYCGGCNPTYARSQVLQALQAHFPRVRFAPFRAEEDWSALVLICGCPAACARPPQGAETLPLFRVRAPAEIPPVLRGLEALLGPAASSNEI